MSAGAWEAIMAVDPGGTTGMSRGVFPKRGSMKGRIRRGKKMMHEQWPMQAAAANVPNSYSDEMAMALAIYHAWREFKEQVVPLVPTLVVEGFVLYTHKSSGTTKREGIYPVRIASALESFLYAGSELGMEWIDKPVYQLASEAKGFATDARLRDWGLWHVGMEHARDASRHLATRLAKHA